MLGTVKTEASGRFKNDLEGSFKDGLETKSRPTNTFQEKDNEAQVSDDSESLNRVQGEIPKEAWLIASFSGAERFAYFALTAPLRMCPSHIDSLCIQIFPG